MRDYLKEMNDFLDLMTPEEDYVAQLVAKEAVETLLNEDKDLLIGWLTLRAASIIAEQISQRSNGYRHKLRIPSRRSAFSEAAKTYEREKNPEVMSPFTFEYTINEDNLRRRVGQMTSADCLFIADRYDDIADNAKMRAAFHRAVAKRLEPGQTVEDVFTEESYLRMYHSVTRRGLPQAPEPKALPS